jgi:phage tail-like protein
MRREAIERLLPLAFQRAAQDGSVLAALLDVMEALHAPDEAVLENVADLYAAYRAPEAMVGFLTRWVAMEHVTGGTGGTGGTTGAVPVGRLRDVVAEGAALAQWRGTPYGLDRLLRTVTGVDGITVEEPPERQFHFVVRVPPAAAGQLDLITRLVRAEKPAATTCEVLLDDPGRTVILPAPAEPAGTAAGNPTRLNPQQIREETR